MGNLNKMTIIGNLCQDPEKRVTPTGASVVTISIAVNEKFTDKQGNKQERTEYIRCVFWDKQAELIAQYCKKGSQLYVEGSLKTREWEDKEGNKRYTTEVIARSMQFLDSRQSQQGDCSNRYQNGTKPGQNQQNRGHQNQNHQDQRPPNQPTNDFDDDLPF